MTMIRNVNILWRAWFGRKLNLRHAKIMDRDSTYAGTAEKFPQNRLLPRRAIPGLKMSLGWRHALSLELSNIRANIAGRQGQRKSPPLDTIGRTWILNLHALSLDMELPPALTVDLSTLRMTTFRRLDMTSRLGGHLFHVLAPKMECMRCYVRDAIIVKFVLFPSRTIQLGILKEDIFKKGNTT